MFIVTKVFNDGYSLEVLDTEDGKAEVIRTKDLVTYLDNGVIPLSNMSTFEKISTGEGVYSFDLEGIGSVVSKYIIKVYFGMYSARMVEDIKPTTEDSVVTGVVPAEPDADWDNSSDDEELTQQEEIPSSEDTVEIVDNPSSISVESDEGGNDISEESDNDVSEDSNAEETALTSEEVEKVIYKATYDESEVTSDVVIDTTEVGDFESADLSKSDSDVTEEVSGEDTEIEEGSSELRDVLTNLGMQDRKPAVKAESKLKDSVTNVKSTSVIEIHSSSDSNSVEDGSSLLKDITGKSKKKSKTTTTKAASKNKANSKTSARKTTFTEGKKKYLTYLSYESGSNESEKRFAFEADLKVLSKFYIIGANDTFTHFVATCKRGKNKGKYIDLVVLDDSIGLRSASDIAFKDKVLKATDRLLSGYVNLENKATTLYRICATSAVNQIDVSAFIKEHKSDVLYTLGIVVTDDKNVMDSIK